jgi:kynureninase
MSNTDEFRQLALRLDAQDPLRECRSLFRIPEKDGKERIYFLGNSLGLQPKATAGAIHRVLGQWADEGVESCFFGEESWMSLHDKLLQPLSVITGAKPHELTIMNQLTVNIHLMLVSFYKPNGSKRKILVESKAFPSDQYALRSHLEHLGLDPYEIIIEVNSGDVLGPIANQDLVNAIKANASELALVFLGGVNYYTGQVFDMQSIAQAAHKAGVLIGLDLAHAVGNVELKLHDWQVDFACWCSYKYLNGGPGTVGGIFVHEKYHGDPALKRFAGWWGNRTDTRFLMKDRFEPEADASGWQLGTPPVVLLAALGASLQIFEQAGWYQLLEKQKRMQQCLAEWVESLAGEHFTCITPATRGCQISLLFPNKGKLVYERLFIKGFMVDWREPNVIRLAPVPLYNTFSEIWQFYFELQVILDDLFEKE